MGVTTYSNFDGLVAETRSGVGRIYVPDTLGSTVEMTDESGATTDTFEYWSYGEERSHTGSSETPFTWLGILGYFKDVLNKLYYVRARYFRPELGRWQTVDPLWPLQPGYVYADHAPRYRVDYYGLATEFDNCMGQRAKYHLTHPEGQDQYYYDCIYCRAKAGVCADCNKYKNYQANNERWQWDLIEILTMGVGASFVEFHHGWYAGPKFAGPPKGSGYAPVDCVDQAAKDHDTCLNGTLDFLLPWKQAECNCQLCISTLACVKHCPDSSCVSAAWSIILFYCGWC